jgi:uncharacterized membrane protein YvlD (DUF360 family)
MKHITALIIKFIMVAVILEIALNLMTALSFGEILWISLVVTVISYVIGDLIVLALTNNTVATLVDFGIALATIYLFNYMSGYEFISFTDALISAIVIGIGEWFFHKYVASVVFPDRKEKET